MKKKYEVNVRDTAIAGSYFELFCMLLTMFDIQLNHKFSLCSYSTHSGWFNLYSFRFEMETPVVYYLHGKTGRVGSRFGQMISKIQDW